MRLHIAGKRLSYTATLLRVGRYSPHWTLTNIVRLGNAKATDGLFDREYLAGLGFNEADMLLETYLPAFERMISILNESDSSETNSFELLGKTFPEIFSRLCYKCSPTYRERLLMVLRGIYGSKQRQVFVQVGKFSRRLFDSMSVEELVRAVPSLIDFPVTDRLNRIEAREFVNPVRQVRLPASVDREKIVVTEEKIDELLEQLTPTAPDREWMMTSLVWLYEQGKLNQQQSELLGRALWDGVKAPGVPVVPGYDSFECIKLPYPSEIDPEFRIKEHLRSVIDERLNNSPSYLDDVLDGLLNSASYVNWSKTDALEWVAKLSRCWNGHNTGRTAGKAIRALSAIFARLPAGQFTNMEVDTLREFLSDTESHNIPARALEAATMSRISENRKQVLDGVTAAMLSRKHDVVADALFAAGVLARILSEQNMHEDFGMVGAMLVEGVQWRHRPALVQRLQAVEDLVEKQSWFLSADLLSGLLAGLSELAEETATGVKGNDRDGVIPLRAAAASLAFSLFKHYQQSGLKEPDAIRRWRELCSNPDEFSEVKNSWLEAGG
ncbi:MAG: hypothetical protein F4Y85_13540 [Gammaproteobacteria bacterium]|nr:hypothetical protein [Gammaproteobacteria bacterium]